MAQPRQITLPGGIPARFVARREGACVAIECCACEGTALSVPLHGPSDEGVRAAATALACAHAMDHIARLEDWLAAEFAGNFYALAFEELSREIHKGIPPDAYCMTDLVGDACGMLLVEAAVGDTALGKRDRYLATVVAREHLKKSSAGQRMLRAARQWQASALRACGKVHRARALSDK